MSKQVIFKAAFFLVIVISGAALYLLGNRHGLSSMTYERVMPGNLANAMQQDHFYSDYGNKSLIISGQVETVEDRILKFKTNTSYQALCTLDSTSRAVKNGEQVTVLSEGGNALRQSNSVMLKNCIAI